MALTPEIEKSGFHLTGTDSGFPVAAAAEPGSRQLGNGVSAPAAPNKAKTVAGGQVQVSSTG